MRLLVTSDFHLEFGTDPETEMSRMPEADVLVIAGDLYPMRSINHARDALNGFVERYGTVVYVPGNHDYYHTTDVGLVDTALKELEQELELRLIVLRPGVSAEIHGHRFLGGTMWFPDGPLNKVRRGMINDFSLIGGFEPWVYEQNRLFRELVSEKMGPGDIIISHHLPSFRSVAPQYVGDPGNCFFVSDEERLIVERQPKLWIHGHTHAAMDYQIGKTRVICNPRGYAHDSSEFDPNKIVEV